MFGHKTLLALGAAVAFIAVPAFAQGEFSGKNEVSVQAFGSFVKTTTSGGIDQSATNSGGVLASYRYFFNQHNGVELNYGYSLNTQNYGLTGGSVGVPSYSHEITADYVLRFPMKRWSPFVLAGAGGLIFDPKNASSLSFAGNSAFDPTGIGTQARAVGVYGAGADFRLTDHIFMRAEYRGLIYNSPTFSANGLYGADRVTHRAEPSVGFGYRW